MDDFDVRAITCEVLGDLPVTPPVDTGGVSGNADVGGDQQHDRVAELERENAELRADVIYLRRSLEAARDVLVTAIGSPSATWEASRAS